MRSQHKSYNGVNVTAAEHIAAGGPAGDKHLTLFEGIAEAGHPLKYGVVALFDETVSTKGDDSPVVLQYEYRPQRGAACDGGYAKLLLSDPEAGEDLPFVTRAAVTKHDSEVDLSKPEYYGIMFGPDKCGMTNKVHFIMRHKNPNTGKWTEHHLRNAPVTAEGTDTALYTLVVRPATNTFEVRVNNVVRREGSLLEELDPPINPPAEIDDPADKKPADWVDEAKIADPEASKPDDWDEDAPAMVLNMDVVKPAGWLDDEPAMVPDPEAEMPEDWDEEEDGEWEAPAVPNPKCSEAPGCGKWVRPTKANPAFKGKWSAPMIDNPDYKGEWAPRRIPNPDFFEDKSPGSLPPLAGLAIEVMINTGGTAFDNVLVTRDEAEAHSFADHTWAVEQAAQAQSAKDASRTAARAERQKLLEDGSAWSMALYYLGEAQEVVEDNMVVAIIIGTACVLVPMILCFSCCSDFEDAEPEAQGGGGTAAVGAAGDSENDFEEEEEEEREGDGPRSRPVASAVEAEATADE